MAGKVQTDHAGICAAYASGLSQEEVCALFGVTKATVCRAVKRGLPPSDRERLRLSRLRAGVRKLGRLKQAGKIARGEFTMVNTGSVLLVTAKGIQFIFDACDEALLRQYPWRVTKDRRLLRQAGREGEQIRNIYVYHDIMGVVPSRALVVDHINHDPADNRRQNLRLCTSSENARNRGCRSNHAVLPTTGRSPQL